jgi:hypothetical protein
VLEHEAREPAPSRRAVVRTLQRAGAVDDLEQCHRRERETVAIDSVTGGFSGGFVFADARRKPPQLEERPAGARADERRRGPRSLRHQGQRMAVEASCRFEIAADELVVLGFGNGRCSCRKAREWIGRRGKGSRREPRGGDAAVGAEDERRAQPACVGVLLECGESSRVCGYWYSRLEASKLRREPIAQRAPSSPCSWCEGSAPVPPARGARNSPERGPARR